MNDFTKLDQLMENFAENSIPGCGCCIMQGDEVIYEKYAGYSDLENGKPVTPDTIYRQASTTKLFTYVIGGMLYEEGKFLFTDPIYEYLPEWKNSVKWIQTANGNVEYVPVKRPMTIGDVVTMRCGLPYCMVPDVNAGNPTVREMSNRVEKLKKNGSYTLQEEVRAMSDVPLMFDPGEHWLYGFGSEIMGAVFEKITGKLVRELFKERLIDPLELKNTYTFHDEDILKQMTVMYSKNDAGIFEKMPDSVNAGTDPAKTHPGARCSLLSTPRDFAIFMQMLANGGKYKGHRFLSPGTVEMLHSDCLNSVQKQDFKCDYLDGYSYGYGFRTLVDKGIGRHNGSLGSFGWTGGFGTWAEADPVRKLSMVYMHNMAPNEELYHHIRFRNTACGCID